MRTYLYTGANKPQDLIHLAVGVAGLKLPVFLASFGPSNQGHPLAPHAKVLPIEIVPVRLPGLGLPCSDTPVDEVVAATTLAVLRQIIAGGEYCLIILDGIRQAIELGLLDVSDLRSLACCALDDTEIAMTSRGEASPAKPACDNDFVRLVSLPPRKRFPEMPRPYLTGASDRL